MGKKKIKKINGRIQSSNFCLSANEKLYDQITNRFGIQTRALYYFFIKKINLKDEWELENFITEKLLESSRISKRDNLTREFELLIAKENREFYKNKLKEKDLYESERESYKEWIKDDTKIIEEIKKKNEKKRR